jgi:Asp-tRNA(Asn)/Glu-tRNA(Gln) amidotransferase C subunit
MTAARITRRLVRKLIKPAALWLTDREMTACAYEAERLLQMREDIVDLVTNERLREVQLIQRRNTIRNW